MADRIQHGRGGGERSLLLFGEVYCCYVSFMVISQFSQYYFMLYAQAGLVWGGGGARPRGGGGWFGVGGVVWRVLGG